MTNKNGNVKRYTITFEGCTGGPWFAAGHDCNSDEQTTMEAALRSVMSVIKAKEAAESRADFQQPQLART